MKESHGYSILKAISWRFFGTFSTMILVFVFTKQWTVSFYIGLLEMGTKVLLFYVHERLWIWLKHFNPSLIGRKIGS